MQLDDQDAIKPDIHSSSDEYQKRFSGKVGEWFVEVQQSILSACLKSVGAEQCSIIDFGGGHGQNIEPMQANSKSFVVLASDDVCFDLISDQLNQSNRLLGGLCDSDIKQNQYDIALSFRMLAHLDDWQAHIAELCRVSSKTVIIEFPSKKSVNAFAESLFTFKKKVEKNTRQYKLFSLENVEKEFAKHNFGLVQVHGQYVAPMAMHRLFKSQKLSKSLETGLSVFLPKRKFGSPMICMFSYAKNKPGEY